MIILSIEKKKAKSWCDVRFLKVTVHAALLEQYVWQLKKGSFLLFKDYMSDIVGNRHEIDCINSNAA